MDDLITRIEAIVFDLSSRDTQPGHVEAATQERICSVNAELIQLYNAELRVTNSGQRFPTSRGVNIKAMILHLMAAIGARSHSEDEHETKIAAAARSLQRLCELLGEFDAGWSRWHPLIVWCKVFSKSRSWCKNKMVLWIESDHAERKGKRGDIRFRLSFLSEMEVEPPS